MFNKGSFLSVENVQFTMYEVPVKHCGKTPQKMKIMLMAVSIQETESHQAAGCVHGSLDRCSVPGTTCVYTHHERYDSTLA